MSKREPPSRLLAVTIDWMPAWMLSPYGSTWVSTPALDRLAASGVVFDRVLAPSISPEESRDSLLSGIDRGRAGGVTNVRDVEAAAGYVATGTDQVVACHLAGLATAWEAPVDIRETYRDAEDPPAMQGKEPPDFAVDAKSDPDRLLTVRQAFAAELTFLDRRLGLLLDAVEASQDGWIVLVAGTSGLPLGLHGQVGVERRPVACIPPYGERVHLPVILRDAAGRMAAQRFPGLVAAADIGATLVELLHGQHPAAQAAVGARSLAGLFDAWQAPSRERLVVRGRGAAATATQDWHLVACRESDGAVRVELYAKPDDFFEVTDVSNLCQGVVESLLPDAVGSLG